MALLLPLDEAGQDEGDAAGGVGRGHAAQATGQTRTTRAGQEWHVIEITISSSSSSSVLQRQLRLQPCNCSQPAPSTCLVQVPLPLVALPPHLVPFMSWRFCSVQVGTGEMAPPGALKATPT